MGEDTAAWEKEEGQALQSPDFNGGQGKVSL